MKKTVSLGGLALGSILFSGCATGPIKSIGEIPSKLYAEADAALSHPGEYLDNALKRPGVGETVGATVLEMAAGRTSNIDSARALIVGSAVMRNEANIEVNRTANEEIYRGNQNNGVANQQPTSYEQPSNPQHPPQYRFMHIIKGKDKNGDGIANSWRELPLFTTVLAERIPLHPDKKDLFVLHVNNDDEEALTANIEIYNTSTNRLTHNERQFFPKDKLFCLYTIKPEEHFDGPGRYKLIVRDLQGDVVNTGSFIVQ